MNDMERLIAALGVTLDRNTPYFQLFDDAGKQWMVEPGIRALMPLLADWVAKIDTESLAELTTFCFGIVIATRHTLLTSEPPATSGN